MARDVVRVVAEAGSRILQERKDSWVLNSGHQESLPRGHCRTGAVANNSHL